MSCSRPLFSNKILTHTGLPAPIPCRSCECCRMDKTNEWISRCEYEQGLHNSASFVTFTYDDEHLPFANDTSLRPTLDYMHFHKYIDSIKHRAKKLFDKYPNKYSHCDKNFKYIASAEYGDKFERPHYHCVFFGLDPFECDTFLKRSWSYGSIQVDPVKPGAFSYIVKYIQKQTFGKLRDDMYYSKGCLPPRLFVSTGLGSGMYLEHSKEISEKGYFTRGQHRVYPNAYYKNKYHPQSAEQELVIESDLWRELHKRFKHYQDLGGNLSYSDWHISQSKIREQRLLVRKLKSLSSTERPSSKPPSRGRVVSRIVSNLERLGYFFDGMPDFDSYKDTVPF